MPPPRPPVDLGPVDLGRDSAGRPLIWQRLRDGGWLVAARHRSSRERVDSLVRVDASGRRDKAFTRNARRVFEVFTDARDSYREIDVRNRLTRLREDHEGHILVVLRSDGRLPETLLRLLPDGRLDRVFTPPTHHIRRVHDLEPQVDGTLYVVGKLRYRGESFGLVQLDERGQARFFSHGPGHRAEGPWLTASPD